MTEPTNFNSRLDEILDTAIIQGQVAETHAAAVNRANEAIKELLIGIIGERDIGGSMWSVGRNQLRQQLRNTVAGISKKSQED